MYLEYLTNCLLYARTFLANLLYSISESFGDTYGLKALRNGLRKEGKTCQRVLSVLSFEALTSMATKMLRLRHLKIAMKILLPKQRQLPEHPDKCQELHWDFKQLSPSSSKGCKSGEEFASSEALLNNYWCAAFIIINFDSKKQPKTSVFPSIKTSLLSSKGWILEGACQEPKIGYEKHGFFAWGWKNASLFLAKVKDAAIKMSRRFLEKLIDFLRCSVSLIYVLHPAKCFEDSMASSVKIQPLKNVKKLMNFSPFLKASLGVPLRKRRLRRSPMTSRSLLVQAFTFHDRNKYLGKCLGLH